MNELPVSCPRPPAAMSLTKAEAVDILTKDFAAGISVYDEIESQALTMADTMTRGIVRQFPRRFL